jgi:hypothetical protein
MQAKLLYWLIRNEEHVVTTGIEEQIVMTGE